MPGNTFFGKNEIKPSDDMATLLAAVPANSLLILDLDKTVMRSDSFEGSETWYHALVDECVRRYGEKPGLYKANDLYNQVQQGRECALAADKEMSWADELAKLRERGVKIIGMTARQGDIALPTIKQVGSTGFSVDRDVIKEGKAEINGEQITVVPGYIFSGNCAKGPALDKVKGLFSSKALSGYSHVSFIDDRRDNCLSMNAMLERNEISHTVTLYTKVDEARLFPNDCLENHLDKYQLPDAVKASEEQPVATLSLS